MSDTNAELFTYECTTCGADVRLVAEQLVTRNDGHDRAVKNARVSGWTNEGCPQ
jgi:hypothetical protein